MTLTYKTDDSFFTVIVMPGDFHRNALHKWFEHTHQSKFRFIRDQEIETEYLSLEDIDEIYPGIKTVAVVTNPWIRAVHAFNAIQDLKAEVRGIPANSFNFDIDNFENFVCNLKNIPKNNKYWFTPTTPQVDWIEYNTEDGIRTVDYLLKSESIDMDFEIIQDYFCADNPLIGTDPLPEYQQYYTTKTRKIIADISAKDIERFGYEF